MKAQQLDLGVAWQQDTATKLLENSASRLSNLLAVGVPTVGYAGYESYKELLAGARVLRLAKEPQELYDQLYRLVEDSSLRAKAAQEALELAALHGPKAIMTKYSSMFEVVLSAPPSSPAGAIAMPRIGFGT